MDDTEEPGLDGAYALSGPAAARRLYAEWADRYDGGFAARSGYRPARRVAETFTESGGRGAVLDAGCGTGLIADHLPEGIAIDGVDLSPEMLAQARAKGRYRRLVEADLTQPLPVAPGYAGLVSAGTFTHGHVPPDALRPLVELLAPGGLACIAANAGFAHASGFDAVLAGLRRAGLIGAPRVDEEPIYGGEAPEGHREDTMLLVRFPRL